MIALVPVAVVGGYLALAARDRDHTDHRRHVIAVADAPSPAAVAHIAAAAPELAVVVHRHEAAATAAEARATAAEARVAAEASGSVTISLDGLLRIITRELERSATDSEEVVLQDLRISATILADLAAELEGLAEIRTTDSSVAIVGASDGARVHVAVER
jgi:hypothetical protein